ncbi:hypothetical protein ACMXYQ_14330 [Neptuniibacter sp. PT34_22]|uniref:hypothetical protein n=1 Tax=Neptuniibacter sp. PT34_22 TaxID=3398205 RepID=UPI0039F563B8
MDSSLRWNDEWKVLIGSDLFAFCLFLATLAAKPRPKREAYYKRSALIQSEPLISLLDYIQLFVDLLMEP